MRDRYAKFFLLLVCVALPIGIIERTGQGVAIHSVFELLIALSLGAGHLIGDAPIRGLRLRVIGACAAPLIVDVGIRADRSTYLIRPWIAEQRVEEAQTRKLGCSPSIRARPFAKPRSYAIGA